MAWVRLINAGLTPAQVPRDMMTQQATRGQGLGEACQGLGVIGCAFCFCSMPLDSGRTGRRVASPVDVITHAPSVGTVSDKNDHKIAIALGA